MRFILLIALAVSLIATYSHATNTTATLGTVEVAFKPHFRNLHDSGWIAAQQRNDMNGDGSYDTDRNYTLELLAADPLFLDGCRSDMDLYNIGTWDNATKVMSWRTDTTNPLRNKEVPINNTAYCASRGYKIWTVEGAPSSMNNISDPRCSYGLPVGSRDTTCAPTSWHDLANATIQFCQLVGCGVGQPFEHSVILACWNEPYGQFFLRNDTSPTSIATKTAEIIAGCEIWATDVKAALPNIKLMTPSFTTTSVCCSDGETMARAFLGNMTSSLWDYVDFHIYWYSTYSATGLYQNFLDAKAIADTYGYASKLVSTETNWENTLSVDDSFPRYTALVSASWLKVAVNTEYSIISPYRWSCNGNSTGSANTDCWFNSSGKLGQAIENGGTTSATAGLTYSIMYDALNYTKDCMYGMDGGTMRNLTASDSLSTMALMVKNSTYAKLCVVNQNNATLYSTNVSLSPYNITSARDLRNLTAQVVNVNNQSLNLSIITNYGVAVYEVFLNATASVPYCGLGLPAKVDKNRAAVVLTDPTCVLTGSQPSGGVSCNFAGVCA